MSSTQHANAWTLDKQGSIENLVYSEQRPLPALKDDEALVKVHAAALNYRDIMIAEGGVGLSLGKSNLIPGSDGTGTVEAVGSKVTTFKVGDNVCTHLTVGLADNATPGFEDIGAGLGQTADCTLCTYGVFHETSLVRMPSNLTSIEAATLTCSGLTAWNALFGLADKSPKPGDTVVVQGTGGVSIAALQFALAAGATVIATTSNLTKANRLKALGAHHVLNYRETPDWGEKVKALTGGAHIVVDVGGASTLQQSLKAVRADGLVVATGVLGDSPDFKVPTILDCLFACCTARGIFLGTRSQFNDMNAFIETHRITPVVDVRVFNMNEVKEAYAFLKEQKHFSKVGIRIG